MASENKKRICKVVVCPDKFKGGLSSGQVAAAIKEGLEDYISFRKGEMSAFSSSTEILPVEMADGGDGSAALFRNLSGDEEVFLKVCGPLGEEVESSYMFCRGASPLGEKPSAFIECARVCGLAMVPEEKRNPLATTTFGLGQMILDAVKRGAGTICIGLGGSATNDCGTGMLQGIGFSLGLPEGQKASGGTMADIKSIAEPEDLEKRLSGIRFLIVNDVDNPLLGPTGATYIYSGQKGADKEAMDMMERDMSALVSRLGKYSRSKKDAAQDALVPGAGAAGGLGFAFLHFLGADSVSGFEFFGVRLQGLSEKIAEADIVISGEGSIDIQSLSGKVVGGCCRCVSICPDATDKRLWLFCGKSSLRLEDLAKSSGGASVRVFQLADIEKDMRARMKREYPLLRQLAYCATMEMDALL